MFIEIIILLNKLNTNTKLPDLMHFCIGVADVKRFKSYSYVTNCSMVTYAGILQTIKMIFV